jgi:hypothetical protein
MLNFIFVLIRISFLSLLFQVTAHSFLLTFIKQSEAVKFASDWKQKGQEPGGRTFKKAFAQSIYFARIGHLPPSNDDPSEDQKNFKTIRKLGWHWDDQAEFISAQEAEYRMSDIVSGYNVL